jgi:undecaprenyl diphosphate synthase
VSIPWSDSDKNAPTKKAPRSTARKPAANAAIAAGAPVNAEDFESFMDSGELLPIDLAVRTSKERRISNFMLWKLAYAELMFYPKYWPALNERDFEKILTDYSERKRRFGK